MNEMVWGLKSRQLETQHKAIRELLHFAKTELREMSPETLTQVLDDFNQQIHALTCSYDNNERKAGVLTIGKIRRSMKPIQASTYNIIALTKLHIYLSGCLIGGDTETSKTRALRYAHYLSNVFPSSDVNLLEQAAKTMGRLSTTLGIKRGEFVESEIKRAFEWLVEERNESKRLSAVLILRELAIATPSCFYQQINGFFNHIIIGLRDPKEQIREASAKALRAAFVLTAQRENPEQSNKAHWYIQSYEEAMKSFEDVVGRERSLTRDDHVHSALLILNELLRCSNAAWEKKYTVLMQKLDAEPDISDDITTLQSKIQGSWPSQHYSDDKPQQPVIHESGICKKLITEKYEKICSGRL